MKILAISDIESKYLWDYFEKSKLEGIELIISCGDLSPEYLSFLVTLSNVPVLYVHGNHDVKYAGRPPEGCTCIEDKIYVYKGVRILGLGGSKRYIPGAEHQYTDREMNQRVRRLFWQMFRRKGFDILVTHSPTFEINDGDDLPHQGFKIFRHLLDKYKPEYHLHGHVHMSYGRQYKRFDTYKDTKVINAFERHVFEYNVNK